MHIKNIDHIVLTVRDIEVTVNFYETVLGMTSVIFGNNRVSLNFGTQKINLHKKGKEFEPKANTPLPGSEDLCFISGVAINVAMKHVKNQGVEIIDGPLLRTGAVGSIISFYFRDPDKNLIEVACYEKVDSNL